MKFDKKIIAQILKGVKWSSAIAAITIGVLLAATILQTRIISPITNDDFNAVFQLIERDPSNQNLRDEIRALDMLARRAYFTSIQQINTGTIIFFAALAVFLIAWNIQTALARETPSVAGAKKSWWETQTQMAKTVAIVSAIIVALSISAGIINKYSLLSVIMSRQAKLHDSAMHLEWWMNFRGPHGNAVAFHTNAPINFDGETMTGITWKVETPLVGFNSPVVFQDKIFLTGGNAEKRQAYAFDVATGKLLWSRDVKAKGIENFEMPRVDNETGFAAPSVATDGKNVYAIFATGELAAFTINGRHLWTKFLGIPDNHYGHASSLITHGEMLFVQFDQYDVGKLFAFDGRRGKLIWEVERTILSWSSPIIVNTGERYELIVIDNEFVTSYEPTTGKKLWSVDCMHGEVGPSAAFANGMVFAANEYAVAAGIVVAEQSADGGGQTLWEVRTNLPNTASPAAVDSLLFLATSGGTVSCLDNRNGNVFWRHEFDRGFYSSPIIVGDKVFLFDRDGVMHVFSASSEFNLIASSSLGENVTTTPAVLDGFLIVRGDKYLYRIDGF